MKKQLILALGLVLSVSISAIYECEDCETAGAAHYVEQLLEKAEKKSGKVFRIDLSYKDKVRLAKQAAVYLKEIEEMDVSDVCMPFIKGRIAKVKENIKSLLKQLQNDAANTRTTVEFWRVMGIASFMSIPASGLFGLAIAEKLGCTIENVGLGIAGMSVWAVICAGLSIFFEIDAKSIDHRAEKLKEKVAASNIGVDLK